MMLFEIEHSQLGSLGASLKQLQAQIARPAQIMRTVAQGTKHQTQVRIEIEKADPSGTPWKPWSEAYAKTRKASEGHSLLKDTWTLMERLQARSTTQEASVFSTQDYAGHVHKLRPFLGWSAQNIKEIENWLAPALEQLFRETVHA